MPGTEALRNLICHTHKLELYVKSITLTLTHSQYIPILLGPVKSGGGGGGATAPPAPSMSPPL